MRIRTAVGILAGLAVVLGASYLSHLNVGLLEQPFFLNASAAIPLWIVPLAVFLLGFVPPVAVLVVQTLHRELASRRERRRSREVKSLQGGFRRAVDLHADGQWAKVAAELEPLLQDQPEEFMALLLHGEALRRQGRPADALEIHRRAAVLYPQSVALLYQLADDYEAQGELQVAREICDRVLRDFAGFGLTVLRRRRDEAVGASAWEEAARLQQRIDVQLKELGDGTALARDEPVRLGLAYQQGLGSLEQERPEEAIATFRDLLTREPRFVPAAIMLGEALLVAERTSEAVEAWVGGYESTGSPVFLQRIEDHFIERAEPARAIETLHQVIARTRDDLLPRFFLGRLYHRLEMHDEALRALRGLSDRIHTSPTYHLVLARAYERRGELAGAVEEYLACIRRAGIATADYRCRACRTAYPEWRDRCDGCGAWNTVELDFAEEKMAPEEPGVRRGPVRGPMRVAGEAGEGRGAS